MAVAAAPVFLLVALLFGVTMIAGGQAAGQMLAVSETAKVRAAQASLQVTCGAEGEGAALALSAAQAAGWPQTEWRTFVMVAGAESGYDPSIVNGIGAAGLMQVLQSAHPEFAAQWTDGSWKDPAVNARMALDVWHAAGDQWTPWEAYTTHRHEAYAAAADAVLGNKFGGSCTNGDPASNLPAATSCATGHGEAVEGPDGQITVCAVGPLVVDIRLAPFVQQMVTDATAAGLHLAGSGWRSIARQRQLYAQNCGSGRCSPPTARPGTSEHERGLALDLTCNGGSAFGFGASPCYAWMVANAARYNLHNLPSESWHWSLSGR